MSIWRDIQSAPRDRDIVVLFRGEMIIARWVEGYNEIMGVNVRDFQGNQTVSSLTNEWLKLDGPTEWLDLDQTVTDSVKTVFVVMRNSDFTEGRGPMLLDVIFSTGEEAVKYVKGQQGIFGSPQKIEMGKYGQFATANGYDIQEVAVLDNLEEKIEADQIAAREKALAKLTQIEKSLLGLG